MTTKEQLKTYFEQQDRPTEEQFEELIDSCFNEDSPISGFDLAGVLVGESADFDSCSFQFTTQNRTGYSAVASVVGEFNALRIQIFFVEDRDSFDPEVFAARLILRQGSNTGNILADIPLTLDDISESGFITVTLPEAVNVTEDVFISIHTNEIIRIRASATTTINMFVTSSTDLTQPPSIAITPRKMWAQFFNGDSSLILNYDSQNVLEDALERSPIISSIEEKTNRSLLTLRSLFSSTLRNTTSTFDEAEGSFGLEGSFTGFGCNVGPQSPFQAVTLRLRNFSSNRLFNFVRVVIRENAFDGPILAEKFVSMATADGEYLTVTFDSQITSLNDIVVQYYTNGFVGRFARVSAEPSTFNTTFAVGIKSFWVGKRF